MIICGENHETEDNITASNGDHVDVAPLGQIVEKPRGDLKKVLPREDLKPRDVPKANQRAQPEGLPSEYPISFRQHSTPPSLV